MNAEIISIGDELLIGQVINTNQAFLAEQLNSIGVAVEQMTTVGDEEEAILKAFASGMEQHDLVLVTGGLGPTHDDITRTAVCRFFHTDLVVNDAVGAAIATSIEVAGAKPATYTFSSAGAGLITLTSSTGAAQQISIGAIAANGTQTLDFNQLGIKITLNSTAGETAANLVTALTAAADDTIVVTGSGSAALQVGANTTAYDSMNVSFNDVRATQAGGLNLLTGGGVDWTSSATIVASNTTAQAFINQIDTAITTLNTRRSDLGAAQNRLEHTVNSLGVSVENLTASESRIRDADVAALSTQMVSNQILQQAGTAVLAQANQSSQAVLSLLR